MELTDLDVSKCTALTNLSCTSNQITCLDISKNTALIDLNCQDNELSSLDISQCIKLISLYCDHRNRISSLDASKCSELKELFCDYDVEVTFCENNLYYDNFEGADSGYRARHRYYKYEEHKSFITVKDPIDDITLDFVITLNYDKKVCLISVDWGDGSEAEMIPYGAGDDFRDEEDFTLTKRFDDAGEYTITIKESGIGYSVTCGTNNITSSNVRNLNYDCSYNNLTSLDVSGIENLEELDCRGNNLSSSALNAMFESLPQAGYCIYISDNPGTDDCDRSIAEDKNWEVE